MTSEEKKALLLLKAIIFHYHGLDEGESLILEETANSIDAKEELKWVMRFIEQDYYDAFDRARVFLNEIMQKIDKTKRLQYLSSVWSANNRKGYISEMEAIAMLKLAQDWQVERELLDMIRNKLI
ncbi:MAG: hypothetical protein RMJ44_01525 [Cytophagales bacterium]|nr:hypothetical protein [Bernardetiaceae bacterium]MDW8209741.1 hypothetical protein [Cytophagales bacterium]